MTWRDRLRLAVQRSGRKHSVIAAEAEIAPETLSRILTGTHTHPQFETVVRIVHAAGDSVGWVLGERGYSLSSWDRERLREAASIIAAATRDGRELTPARFPPFFP